MEPNLSKVAKLSPSPKFHSPVAYERFIKILKETVISPTYTSDNLKDVNLLRSLWQMLKLKRVNLEDNDRIGPGILEILIGSFEDPRMKSDTFDEDDIDYLFSALIGCNYDIHNTIASVGSNKYVIPKTLLIHAMIKCDIRVAQIILEYTSDAELQNLKFHGFTPLHFAAALGHGTVAEILLDRGVPVNAVSLCGTSALHLAVRYVNDRIIQLLMRCGADPNLKTLIPPNHTDLDFRVFREEFDSFKQKQWENTKYHPSLKHPVYCTSYDSGPNYWYVPDILFAIYEGGDYHNPYKAPSFKWNRLEWTALNIATAMKNMKIAHMLLIQTPDNIELEVDVQDKVIMLEYGHIQLVAYILPDECELLNGRYAAQYMQRNSKLKLYSHEEDDDGSLPSSVIAPKMDDQDLIHAIEAFITADDHTSITDLRAHPDFHFNGDVILQHLLFESHGIHDSNSTNRKMLRLPVFKWLVISGLKAGPAAFKNYEYHAGDDHVLEYLYKVGVEFPEDFEAKTRVCLYAIGTDGRSTVIQQFENFCAWLKDEEKKPKNSGISLKNIIRKNLLSHYKGKFEDVMNRSELYGSLPTKLKQFLFFEAEFNEMVNGVLSGIGGNQFCVPQGFGPPDSSF